MTENNDGTLQMTRTLLLQGQVALLRPGLPLEFSGGDIFTLTYLAICHCGKLPCTAVVAPLHGPNDGRHLAQAASSKEVAATPSVKTGLVLFHTWPQRGSTRLPYLIH